MCVCVYLVTVNCLCHTFKTWLKCFADAAVLKTPCSKHVVEFSNSVVCMEQNIDGRLWLVSVVLRRSLQSWVIAVQPSVVVIWDHLDVARCRNHLKMLRLLWQLESWAVLCGRTQACTLSSVWNNSISVWCCLFLPWLWNIVLPEDVLSKFSVMWQKHLLIIYFPLRCNHWC